MGTIRRPSDSSRGGTEANAFIQCINGREPQNHELWCLDLDGINSEVHPTVHVDFLAGTVGDFVTDYLDKNGSRIDIIGKLSVNNGVQFLGLSDQS